MSDQSHKGRTLANPVWQMTPYELQTELGPDGWEYYVLLDGEEFMEGEDFEDEAEAVKAAMARLDEVEIWREPDYEDVYHALWWDPHEKLADAEHVTQVAEGCVTEYTFVGGYEGFKDDQWLKITTCPDDPPSEHPRALVSVGVNQIGERGGDEEVLSNEEVQVDWPRVARKKNPADVKRRMLDLAGYGGSDPKNA